MEELRRLMEKGHVWNIPWNACKLDWEENIFGYYVEPIFLKIKILINITLF